MSLKTKLIVLMVAILGATVIVSYVIFDRSKEALLQQVVEHVRSVENVNNVLEIQQLMTTDLNATIQRTLSVRLGQPGRVAQISLLNLSSKVIASSIEDDIGLSLEELKDRRVRHPKTSFWDTLLKTYLNTYDVTIPIYENGVKRGYINVVLVMNDLEYLIKKAQYSNMLWIIGIFVGGTLSAIVVVNRFIKPVDLLVSASKAVANGNFDTTIAIPRGSGELRMLISGFNEMTEKLREHKALEQRVHRTERMAALGELGARLAHEIRNPLNSINLIIDHLRDRFSPAEDKDRQRFDTYVVNIKTELQRLNKLVSDFLHVSRPLHPEIRSLQVAPFLQQITQLLGNQAAQHQIEWTVSVTPENLVMAGDEGLLKTACMNVTLNAIQAMENGGRLTIEAKPSADAHFCEMTFTDTGAGIPQEHRENIFQPYFTTKKEGTGLGLSIVNRVIEDHGGQIRVESEESHGTTITLMLPMPEE